MSGKILIPNVMYMFCRCTIHVLLIHIITLLYCFSNKQLINVKILKDKGEIYLKYEQIDL